MNWAEFKNPVSHMCLVVAVVVYWSNDIFTVRSIVVAR